MKMQTIKLLAVAVLLSGMAAEAQEINWWDTGTNTWSNLGSWDTGALPTSTSNVRFTWTGGTCIIDTTAEALDLMGAHSEVPEIQIVTNGSLSVNNWLRLGNWGEDNAMSLRVDGGTLTVGGEFCVAEWQADADVELVSGNIIAKDRTKIGNDGSVAKTGTGVMTISGGVYSNNTGRFQVGARSEGTLNMSGGVLAVDPEWNGWFPFTISSHGDAGSGTVNLTGGLIDVALVEMEYNETDDPGTAQLNLLGGVFQVENAWAAAMRVEDQSEIHFDKGVFRWKGDMVGIFTTNLVQAGFVTWTNGMDTMLSPSWDASWTNGTSVLFADYDDSNGYTSVWAYDLNAEPIVIGDVSIAVEGTSVILGWDASALASYSVESMADMNDGTWGTAHSNLPGVAGTMYATNTAVDSECFYRIVLEEE
jgi:hypothetical protein